MKLYIKEQFNGKWALCAEFECGGSGVMLDRVLIKNLSKKRVSDLLKQELTKPENSLKTC